MIVFFYILAIALANVVTAAFAPLNIGPMIVPWGTLLIGATFILRDLVQNHLGRIKTYYAILAALVVSGITSAILGDPLYITLASAITFLISETVDTEIYTRMNAVMHIRVLWSGVIGGILDSSIFVIVGLSPIGANFLPWEAVPLAIIGQVIVKTVLQGAGSFALWKWGNR